jgi:hypothetical protein
MWVQNIGTILSGISAIVSIIVYITVKFNDIKHIQIAVEKIEKHVEELSKVISSDHEATQKEINDLSLNVREVTVRCQERHRKDKIVRQGR